MERDGLAPDSIGSRMSERPVPTDSQSQRAASAQQANPADVPSPSNGHVLGSLSDIAGPSSMSFKGTGILKGTGPALEPSSSHRQRPDVTYNLKELIHKTRVPPKNQHTTTTQQVPEEIDLTKSPRVPNDSLDQKLVATTSEHTESQSAKRQRTDEGDNSARNLSQGHLWNTAIDPGVSASLVPNANHELIAYIWPILLDGGVTNPGELLGLPFYQPFICNPRKRDMEWNPATSCGRWTFRTKIDVVALLVQLTGDYSPKCCNRCDPEIGLFKGCIITHSKTLARTYYGCTNCLYHGRQTFCNLKSWNRQNGATDPGPKKSISNDIATTVHERGELSKSTMITRPKHGSSTPDAPRETSLIAAGGSNETSHEPGQILSMEPWERAPGRIRSQVSAAPENIAFSKPYLATGHEVQVCREATFRVETIRSGHIHKLKAEDNITRICSIASAGKLCVKLDGEEPLVIGPHGMFTVRPHSECLVESEIYDDVVLHITSVKIG